jgi:hypothetical protein
MTVRLAAWEPRLHAYLDGVATKPFEYGSHDCALHAANAVLAMTGDDFGAPFRGRYKSAAGAVRALRDFGAGDLPKTLTAALGEPVHPAFAGRGDIVMANGSAGVCMGDFAWFVGENAAGEPGADGLIKHARSLWSAAWTVSHG